MGIVQRQHIAETEHSGAVKWAGKVDDEIVYSYKGIYWMRSQRVPLMPGAPLGEFGSEQVSTSSIVELADGSLRFYSHGDIGEHYGGAIEVYLLRLELTVVSYPTAAGFDVFTATWSKRFS